MSQTSRSAIATKR